MKNTAVFELPTACKLSLPRDYVRNGFGSETVWLLDGCEEGALRASWDDDSIAFQAVTGGVAYRRSVVGFEVNRSRRVMSTWTLCELSVRLHDGSMPIIYADVASRAQFDQLLDSMISAGVPLFPLSEHAAGA